MKDVLTLYGIHCSTWLSLTMNVSVGMEREFRKTCTSHIHIKMTANVLERKKYIKKDLQI